MAISLHNLVSGTVSLVSGAWSTFCPAPAKIASWPFTRADKVQDCGGLQAAQQTNAMPKNSGDGEWMIFKAPEARGYSCLCWLCCPLPFHGESLPAPYQYADFYGDDLLDGTKMEP